MKSKTAPKRAPGLRRVVLRMCLVMLLIGGGSVGLYCLRQYVERKVVFPTEPPQVVLKNRPAWMSDFLAERIAATARPIGTHSPLDHQMLVDAERMLRRDPRISPWIREIRQLKLLYVHRPGDTLEIDCEYRAPVALVRWGDYYWLVDGEGSMLPEHFTREQIFKIIYGRDGKVNIRLVQGVHRPPPEPGRKWPGEDLAAGLDVLKLMYGRDYAEEILAVDVANFQGRQDAKESQLVLLTRHLKGSRPD